jgi:hypothetical protein
MCYNEWYMELYTGSAVAGPRKSVGWLESKVAGRDQTNKGLTSWSSPLLIPSASALLITKQKPLRVFVRATRKRRAGEREGRGRGAS